MEETPGDSLVFRFQKFRFQKKIICDSTTFLFSLFHNTFFFILRNYFHHGGGGITWGILLLPSHVVDM